MANMPIGGGDGRGVGEEALVGDRWLKEPFHSAENQLFFFLFALPLGCPGCRGRNFELLLLKKTVVGNLARKPRLHLTAVRQ